MKSEGIIYIIPLRRNVPLIDYSKLQNGLLYEKLDGFFSFEKRIVWYYTFTKGGVIVSMLRSGFLKAESSRY